MQTTLKMETIVPIPEKYQTPFEELKPNKKIYSQNMEVFLSPKIENKEQRLLEECRNVIFKFQ